MKVVFYFDPSCPFSWITSRWVSLVSSHRDISVDWRPLSLAIKNNELEAKDGESSYASLHRDSHRVLRVMMAATKQHGAQLSDLYTSFGIKHHVSGDAYDDGSISSVLARHKLPESLLQEADKPVYDDGLKAYIDEAVAIVGQDIGVPTVIFTAKDGNQQGFFGPVLQELPGLEESLELWDGLSRLATSPSFFELKRSRPDMLPDVGSTARC